MKKLLLEDYLVIIALVCLPKWYVLNQIIQATEVASISVAIGFGADDLADFDVLHNQNDLNKFIVIQKV